jgi:hypothetical protein
MALHHLHRRAANELVFRSDPHEPTLEPCFGVACPRHATCFCYGLVETSGRNTARATCMRDGEYPGYVPAAVDAFLTSPDLEH